MWVSLDTPITEVAKAHVGSSLGAALNPLADTERKNPMETLVICSNKKFASKNDAFAFPEVSKSRNLLNHIKTGIAGICLKKREISKKGW